MKNKGGIVMAFCPKCGNKVNAGDQFCVKCGNSLESSTEQSSAKKRVDVDSTAKYTKAPVSITMSILVFFAMIAAVVFFNVSREPEFSDNPAAIEQSSKSVVLLECYDKKGELYCTGSAFAAFEDGVFVTNYHVVEQEVYRIIAKTEEGTMFEIDFVLAYEPRYDIAIIKTKANPNISPLPIGTSADLEKGEKIVAIGSPLGLLNTVSTGVFSGYNDTGVMNEIQFSASISHGSSGGALFNNAGEVIGITTASYTEGQNLNVAIPIQYAIDIKDANSTEMTVSQFYETFDHYNEYTVSDLLQNTNLKEELAYVYGIVADMKDHELILVSNEAQMVEYQRLRSIVDAYPQTSGPLTWEKAVKEYETRVALVKDKETLKRFEINNTVSVYDKGQLKKLGSRCQVGDVVCVLASIERWPYKDRVYQIAIQNEECIICLSEQASN